MQDNQHNEAQNEAQNEALVRAKFWPKLKPLLKKLPFVQDLLAAYYCAFDEATPFKVKVILFSALAYFILPLDLIPDFIPVIGFSDDAAALAAAIAAVKGAITPDHNEAARRILEEENHA
jgi:uncharacterized membrane protein YkvA (DUF1232 family)